MHKSKFVLIVVLAMVAALFISPVAAQEEDRWDGADDLEVNPLDCPMAEGEEMEA
jgi:ABC-type cobalt transport system substrate-binding protein